MLLAHELIRNAMLDGDTMVPDVVVDLSDVEEAVRSNRAKLPHAPGDRLPKPAGAYMPWESAVYEHPLEGEEARRRNIYASQARSAEGLYRITLTVVDMGLADEELEVSYYGACSVTLNELGVLVAFERDEEGDAGETLVADGQLLEMVFPVLIANHLVNTGVMGPGSVTVVQREQPDYYSALAGLLGARWERA